MNRMTRHSKFLKTGKWVAVSAIVGGLSLVLILTALTPTPVPIENSAPSAPLGLLTNDLTRPLNIEGQPSFGWLPQDADRNEIQSGYQIRLSDHVTGGQVWDSGKVTSASQSYVPYTGVDLSPGGSYEWSVRTWDRSNEVSAYSSSAQFSTGLTDSDWRASWLQFPTESLSDEGLSAANLSWLARTEVPINGGKVAEALAFVSASHDYELSINGSRVGRGQSFDPEGESRYQAWDITKELGNDSAIAVGVLSRWYGAGQGRAANVQGLLVHISLRLEDGSTQLITSDDKWQVASAPLSGDVARNSEGEFVEEYDGRNERIGWTDLGFDVSTWIRPAVLGAHPTAPFTHLQAELGHVTETLVSPETVTLLPSGETIIDFGRVIPARFTVDFAAGVEGRTVPIIAGYEITSAGTVDASPAASQATNMAFLYTQRAGAQRYNSFDHLAFRYLEIPPVGEAFSPASVSATILTAEVPDGRDSSFSSSNGMLDRVFELMKRSAMYSVQNQFVDTPTREKGQFLQDTINISAATTVAWSERASTRKAINQFLSSADRYWNSDSNLGRYNAVYPNGDGMRDIPDFTLAMVKWVWDFYLLTGDRDLLAHAYPYLVQTGEYVSRSIPSTGATAGLVTRLPGGSGSYEFGIVDWPATGRFDYDMSVDARTTVNAISVGVFDTLAEMAKELERPFWETSNFESRATALRQAMNSRLINSSGSYSDGLLADGTQSRHASQHATSYALAFDIAPPEMVSGMARFVADLGMKQGPMTANILVEGLITSDRADAALALLTRKDDLGWAKLVDEGHTFTWETWSKGESQSHGWGAAAATEILDSFLGVSIVEAGASAVRISPNGILQRAEGQVFTQRGPIRVSYSGSGTAYNLKVHIPVNATAEIEFPLVAGGIFVDSSDQQASDDFSKENQVVKVGSGDWDFHFEARP